MFLLLSRNKVIKQTVIKTLQFCIKISSFKTSMLQFLRKTKFRNLPLEFCKSMQRLWSTSKKPSRSFPSIYCRDELLTKVSGMPLNLPPLNCRLFLNRVFKDGAEDHRSCQSSSVYPYEEALDEVSGQPVLPCLSRRLCYLTSESISCIIEFKVKQIRK